MTVQFSFVWADSEKSNGTFLRKPEEHPVLSSLVSHTNDLSGIRDRLRSLGMSYPRSQAQTNVRERGIGFLRHDVCLVDYRSCTDEVKLKTRHVFVVIQANF